MQDRWIHFGLLMLTVPLLAGCGSDETFGTPVAVSGTITRAGAPVSNAQVTFFAYEGDLPAGLRSQIVTTDSQGVYVLDEVYPAEYQVSVESLGYNVEEAPADPTAATPGDDSLAGFGAESPLRAVVSQDSTQFDFELSRN